MYITNRGWVAFSVLIFVAAILILFRPFLSLFDESLQVEGGVELAAVYEDIGYDLTALQESGGKVPKIFVSGFPEGWADSLELEQKKTLFYQSILPLMLSVNKEILRERKQFNALLRKKHLTKKQQGTLKKIGNRYGLSLEPEKITSRQTNEALRRIDTIPVAMGLGQAAYESGYATSRFAVKGNALFGQWRWGEGLIPKKQRAGKGDYRIATFPTPLGSVKAYALNLNTHRAYRGFRKQREAMRRAGELPFSSRKLIETMTAYSEKGEEYVRTLQGIIEENNLWVLDNVTLRKTPVQEVGFLPH